MKLFLRLFFGAALALLASAVSLRAAAVLNVTGVTATPGSVQPGQSVQFTVSISNASLAPTGGGTANDFLGGSADVAVTLSSLTADPIVLGSQSVFIPAITASGTGTVNVSFTIPSRYSQAASYFAQARLGFRPTGSTTTATATVSGTVSAINVTSGGSNYSAAPTVNITGGGGAGATARAVVAGGAVIAIDVVNAGAGYTSSPTISFTNAPSDATGSGATASSIIDASLSSIAINSAGSGYGSTPVVLITGGGGGNFASASGSLTGGVVSSFAVTGAGSGYTTVPTVTVTGGGGAGATGTAVINASITTLNLVTGGTKYTNPTVTFTGGGGTGATASATVTPTIVTALTLTAGGTGYSANPVVTISGGGGTGATASATVSPAGVITALTITANGTGYTTAPTVAITDATGTGATATASVGGVITALTITSGGSGYTSAPVVTINDSAGSGGTGATATTAISGSLSSITLTAAGAGFTSAPTVSVSAPGGAGVAATAVANINANSGGISVTGGGSNYTTTPTVVVSGGGPSSVGNGTISISSYTTPSQIVTVTGQPDLVITGVNYPAGVSYKGGDIMPMSLTFTNNQSSNGTPNVPFKPSTGGATYFRIQIVLSANPTYGDSDDFLLTFLDVPTTVNSDGVNHTFSWNQLLPGNFSGSYYVLAKIDSLTQVAESIESDFTLNGNNIWQDVAGTRIALLPTTFPTMYLASTSTTGSSGNGYSDNPSITSDGRYTVFASDASNLVANDTNNVRDIFIFDSQTSTTRRLNLSQQGAQANAASATPAISAAGRYVAFSSDATNLILGDNNGFSDIFVVDVITGAISLESVATNPSAGVLGTQANGSNFRPSLSSDGRYVVFESSATNLITGGTAVGVTNIYLRDRTTGVTTLVSRATGAAGAAGNGSSIQAVISADGNYVAFASLANNLVAGDTNGLRDVFLRDLVGNTTIRVSVGAAGAESVASPIGGDSRAPSISQDGRYIAFSSEAPNLVAGDTNGTSDIFVYDRVAATTSRVSVSSAGTQATDPAGNPFLLGSINPYISATGRYVTFASMASNLAPGDAAGRFGTLASATVAAGAVTAVSITNPGAAAGSANYTSIPAIVFSGGGGTGAAATATLSGGTSGYITGFTVTSAGSGYTSAPNVTIAGAFNGSLNIYVADRDVSASGTFGTAGNIATSIVSVNKFGYQSIRVLGAQSSAAADIYPVISADGRWVALPSDAETSVGLATTTTNLLSNDSNGARDVFLHDRRINALPTASSPPTVTITSPGTGGSALVNTAIQVTASATAATVGGTVLGVVSRVEFYVNGTSLGSTTVFPYTATWTPTAVGSYTLSALVTDSFGNLGVSSNVVVSINAAPSVGLTNPVAGTNININTTVAVTATAGASNPGGVISAVQFFANGLSLGTDNAAPFSVNWTPSVAGNYTLTAVATETIGAQTTQSTSPAVAVSVVVPGGSGGGGTATPPIVSLDPLAASTASVNARVNLSASASAGSASTTIANVQFFAGSTLIGSDNTAPYTFVWTPQSLGTFILTAVATDNLGASTTSSPRTITVNGTLSVALTSPAGGSTISVNVPQTLTANASVTNGTVVSVQFLANGSPVGTVSTFPYSTTWTPATPGTYSLVAVATDNTGAQSNSVANVVTVASTTPPPVVSLTSSLPTVSSVNARINLSASATPGNPVSTISDVKFYANGSLIGSDNTAPYTAVWTPAAVGTYLITAVATDNLGASTTTTAVTVNINGVLAVAVTSPVSNANISVNQPQTVVASATVTNGTVVSVQFLANGNPIGTATSFPYSVSWTPVTAGTYTLMAVATDNTGAQANSAVNIINVGTGTAPTVSIVSPSATSSIPVGSPQTILANASAGSGTIASVQFLANGVVIGTDTTFPYNQVWTPNALGSVELTAIATDTLGNRSTSTPVTVSVAGVSPGQPVVSLSAPIAGASLPVGIATTIAASASDPDGTIALVEFFANGVSIGTKSVFPYNVVFTPAAPGLYVLTARATDNGGNIATSSATTVSVSGGTAPSVAITAPTAGATVGVNASQTITATATSSGGTIASVQFLVNGVALGGADATFPYAATWTPTALGTYSLTARATDSFGNFTDSAPIVLTVAATAAPTVALTSPSNGSSFTAGTTINLAANAADSDGNITQVQFLVNGQPQGAPDTAAPYVATWTPGSVGLYTVTAQATDNSGNVTLSAPVTVSIGSNAAPTVDFTSPTAGSYSLGNQILINVSASDSDGTVTGVQFFANGVPIGSATAAPFTLSWRAPAAGNYGLTAIATDNVGNATTSSPVSVTVTSVAAPGATITNPVAGTSYLAGNAIPLVAATSGGNGPIAQVQFFVNGVSLGTDNSFPYTSTWTPAAPGNYSLVAIATDSAGISSTATALAIVITGNQAPTVAITAPGGGTRVNAGTIVNLVATAADVDGTVASVRFLANGNAVGAAATTAPFTTAWTPSAAGTYSIVAQASDNSGNVTNSAAINVIVSPNASPVVALAAPTGGSVVRAGAVTNLTANASDADGTIASVQFFANGAPIGAAITAVSPQGGYRTQWTPTAEGIYRLTAVALDNAGATTTTTTVMVLAVSAANGGTDNVYTGTYSGSGELGRFAVISVRGKTAAFIGYSTSGAAKTYYFPGLSLDNAGGFILPDSLGRIAITGSVNDTGVSGQLDANRLFFIGPVSFPASTGSIASGYYSGNLTGRSGSTVAAIIGPDGSIMLYASEGTFQAAGAGAIDGTGAFSVVVTGGARFTGKADPATGFLTGTLSGTNGGAFTAATSSGVAFSDGFLRNLSTRGQVGTGSNILIAGFVVGGTVPKQVLVRAIGPTLTSFGLSGALADPQLQIFNSSGALVVANNNWGGAGDVIGASASVGAFPLATTSLDAVALATLSPGAYTAQVSGVNGTTGVALVELYDVDSLQPFSSQKVMNVATRGVVGTGQSQLIAGFVVSGNTAKKVLIRAVGPTLAAAPFNVAGVLADPSLVLVRSDNVVVRENDNWETGNDAALINEAAIKVGAFPLATGSKDAAILLNLPPGIYSAQVTGPGTTTGVALVEVYEVP